MDSDDCLVKKEGQNTPSLLTFHTNRTEYVGPARALVPLLYGGSVAYDTLALQFKLEPGDTEETRERMIGCLKAGMESGLREYINCREGDVVWRKYPTLEEGRDSEGKRCFSMRARLAVIKCYDLLKVAEENEPAPTAPLISPL